MWQHTEDITEMSLENRTAEEFDIEQGDAGMESGVKVRVKARLEELLSQTEEDAFELAGALNDEIAAGQVEVETRGRLIIIRIREKGSFISGSAEMAPSYKDVMREVKAVLALKKGKIEVQGHTDDIPIRTSRFRSNWDLSATRAVSVAHELMLGGDIGENRFEVAGFSSTLPLVPNNSSENRAINRRVEILVKQALEEEMDEEDMELLKDDPAGEDILRELNLEPEYLFDLEPEEIF